MKLNVRDPRVLVSRLVRHGLIKTKTFAKGGGDPVILSLGRVVMEGKKDLRAMRFTNDTTENRPLNTTQHTARCAEYW